MIVTGKVNKFSFRFFQYLLLGIIFIIILVPIFWFVVTSFKTTADALGYTPSWIPKLFTVENYYFVLFSSNILRYLLNSFIVTGLTIIVTLVFASHMAYAVTRFEFRFKNVMLFIILMTGMIPGICIITSLYSISVGLKVHNTYSILIIVLSAAQFPAQVWLLKGFFSKIPIELEESAKLEGVSTLGIFYRIVVPLSAPGLAAGSVLIFVNTWNDWLISSALTASEKMRLINVGLFDNMRENGVLWGRFTAYGLIAILPILALFFKVQRHFIQGLTAGATKG